MEIDYHETNSASKFSATQLNVKTLLVSSRNLYVC